VCVCVWSEQTMTDVAGNPEEERRADFYYQPWAQEAVCRYFYGKVYFVQASVQFSGRMSPIQAIAT